MNEYHQYKIGWIRTSNIEILDLLKSWIIISLAFAIAFTGLELNISILYTFLASLVIVGTAFLLHEIGHKLVAQKFKYPAEFRAFTPMLILALALSLIGIVIAAPGAVMIHAPNISKKKNGIISLAGPATNIFLALIFFTLFHFIVPGANIFIVENWKIGDMLIQINSFIALFNLIPVWLFDGAKIFKWNKIIWVVCVLLALGFTFGL